MTQRLNITNGDSAADTLGEAGIAGKIIAWRDVLHEGRVDASLSLEALTQVRARFISEKGWGDFAHVSGDFAERDRMIRHLDYFDEVTLWFEDDLYDQLQMVQLLDFFSRDTRRKRISLIVVDGYIPPLSPAKLKDLDAARTPVTMPQLELAQKAWKAFGSDDPESILRLLAEDTSALPYLAPALKRHLEEFPSLETGLSRSEREALTAIDQGHTTPVAAFLEAAKHQESIFLGDIIFFSYLERMSGRNNALVTWADGTPVIAPTSGNSRDFVKRQLKLTPLGREVLGGAEDWQSITSQTRWLGGVEIKPGRGGWRWDAGQRVLVRAPKADRGNSKRGELKEAESKPRAPKRSSRKKK